MIRIAQNSTNIPNQQLSEMIEYVVSQLQVPRNFDVMLKNSSSKANSSGTFYQGGTFQRYRRVASQGYASVGKPFKRKHRIMVNLATDENAFPVYSGGMTGGYLPDMFLSREEYLINILAHEMRHFWQTKHSRINRKMWRVWHSKRKSSYMETDADAFAIRIQRDWRKLKTPREVYRMVKEE